MDEKWTFKVSKKAKIKILKALQTSESMSREELQKETRIKSDDLLWDSVAQLIQHQRVVVVSKGRYAINRMALNLRLTPAQRMNMYEPSASDVQSSFLSVLQWQDANVRSS